MQETSLPTATPHRAMQLTCAAPGHCAGVSYDVLVAGCLPDPKRWEPVLDPQRQQAAVLPAMVQHVLGTTLTDMAAALHSSGAGAALTRVEAQTAAEVWATLLLRDSFTSAMQGLADGGQLQQLFGTIEVPVQRVLSAMEVTGVRCDKQQLLQQRYHLQVRQAPGGMGEQPATLWLHITWTSALHCITPCSGQCMPPS